MQKRDFFHFRKIIFISIILLVSISFCYIPSAFADYSFGAPTKITNNGGVLDDILTEPHFATSGNNVYAIWNDAGDVYFDKSSDNGTTFTGSPTPFTSTGNAAAQRIAVSGNDVYVTWVNNNKIFFSKSTDGGSTFNGGTTGSPGPATDIGSIISSSNPQLAVDGSNVYITWIHGSDVFFVKSTDNGSTFSSPANLSSTTHASNQQIAIYGSSLYVVWQDSNPGNNDIFFSKSTDGGSTFNGGTTGSPGTPTNISNNTSSSTIPQISADGSNVYITWIDNSDVFFVKSTNGGDNFSTSVNLSSTTHASNQQIAIYGSSLYVVWQDSNPGNNDIFFSKSTDGGSIFNGGTTGSPGTPTNISSNSGSSVTPQIIANGNNVGIVWRDDTSAKNDILFKSSTDNGATFGGLINLSTSLDAAGSTDSTEEIIAVSGSRMEIVFLDDSTSPGIAYDVFFISGLPTGTSITFDSSQYQIGATATISISSPSSNTNAGVAETISPVTINSTSDSTGITSTFTETGVNTGVFSSTVTFITGLSSGSSLHVSDGDTITVTFGGRSGTANIFARNVSFNLAAYFVNSTAITTVTDNNANTNPSSTDTVSVLITSTSNPNGATINLPETGVNTGIFKPTSNLHFNVKVGDTLTASYMGKTASSTIISGPGGGGGGGGLIRPGLVLDAIIYVGGGPSISPSLDLTKLAAIHGMLPDDVLNLVINHEPFKPIPPIKNSPFDLPLSIDGNGYALAGITNTIATEEKDAGKPVDMLLNFLSSNEIVHAAFYMNLPHDSDDLYKSDTYIIYEKGEPLQIIDPHGFFDNVKFNITKSDLKNTIDYKITFAKPMNKSDIDFRIWDEKHSSADTRILDALQVVALPSTTDASSIIPTNQKNNITSIINQKNNITSIINQKNNTGISSTVENNYMQYIKEWGGYDPKAIGDSEFLEKMGMKGNHIPSWFTKNTRYLVDGQTSMDEFVSSLRYVYNHTLIK